MLEIKALMNSTCRDVLAFKTCCGLQANDQNLEIHVRNVGDRPVVVVSVAELVTTGGPIRLRNLMPHGNHTLAPGALMAFYCSLDEGVWQTASELAMFDDQGGRYRTTLST